MSKQDQENPGSESGHGCEEYRGLSRRQFLRRTGVGAAGALVLPHWLPTAVGSSIAPQGDVFISVFLRGGMDGLSLVAPYGDSYYSSTARPNLALGSGDVIDVDGYFGFNARALGLHNIFRSNALAVVHDVALRYPFVGTPSRSHFQMMDVLEFSAFSNGLLNGSSGGWIGRHLNETPGVAPISPLRAAALSVAVPKSHAGNAGSLPVNSPENFGLGGEAASKAARRATLESMFMGVDPVLETAATTTFGAIDLLGMVDFAGYVPSATYPSGSEFGAKLKNTAALLKAKQEIESVHIDYGGWDDHNNLLPTGAAFGDRVADLGDALWAFYQDMGTAMNRVTILVYSEFGRRVSENASGGTDHGHGNCCLVIGNNVNGGLYVPTNWTSMGLQSHIMNLNNEDLPGTYDFREIYLEIVRDRLMNTSPVGTMFPEFVPGTPLGIVS